MSARIMRKFNEAANVATRSTMAEKHGAVVVAGGKTLAQACNSLQPTRDRRFGCWMHAEVAVLKTLKRRVQRSEKEHFRDLCGSHKDGQEWKHKNHEF